MNSALYTGRLRHRRHAPRRHCFEYSLALAWLDLAELDQVFAGRWFWSTRRPNLVCFRRADYLGDPAVPLDRAVREMVERETGSAPTGPIRLLTQLRTFGHCFNPVSFYYCFDAAGETVQAIVAEITNTPWKERHAYVLAAGPDGASATFDKQFHVSPFFPMEQTYEWRLGVPGEQLRVEMVNREKGAEVFRAGLALRRSAWSAGALRRAALLQPLMAWKVHAAIHWQALRLWVKGVPFHVHPGKRAAQAAPRSPP